MLLLKMRKKKDKNKSKFVNKYSLDIDVYLYGNLLRKKSIRNVQTKKQKNDQNQNNINYILEENERLKKEIKELKLRLENGDFERKTKMVDYNKIRCVTFVSNDLQVICGLKCLITDTFAEVEEKLYKIYPEYRETNNIFQVNGKQILRFTKSSIWIFTKTKKSILKLFNISN